jgi:hypothetical protein
VGADADAVDCVLLPDRSGLVVTVLFKRISNTNLPCH